MKNSELKKIINEEIRKIIAEELSEAPMATPGQSDKLQKNVDLALKSIKNSSLRAKVKSLIDDPDAMKSLKNTTQRAAFLTAMALAAEINPMQFTSAISIVKKNLSNRYGNL